MKPHSEDETALLTRAAQMLSEPLCAGRSSFVLHAPLELSARILLLAQVSPQARAGVLARIGEIVDKYGSLGQRIAVPATQFETNRHAAHALNHGIDTHDADEADRALSYLAQHTSAHAVRAELIDVVAPSLAAAAHAPIVLADLDALPEYVPHAALLLRAPLRYVLSENAASIAWHLASTPKIASSLNLFDVLALPPHIEAPSTSIAPTLTATMAAGHPERYLRPVLAGCDFQTAANTLLRVAACAMLQDAPEHAAYGWSHCLTIPLGLMRNADVSANPVALLAIAATHTLAFRATLGQVKLAPTFDAHPHAPVQTLIDEAAQHADAHMAKYMHACLHAAQIDSECAGLYFAAAEHLLRWWRAHDA